MTTAPALRQAATYSTLDEIQGKTAPEIDLLIAETEARLNVLRCRLAVLDGAEVQPGRPIDRRRRVADTPELTRSEERDRLTILAFLTAFGPATTETIRQTTALERDRIAGLLWHCEEVQRTPTGHWRLVRGDVA